MAGATTVHRARLEGVAAGRERPATHDLLRGASVVGLLAGAAMLVWASASAALAGLPASRPLALAAATFSPDAIEGGAGSVAAGALLWAAVSVALGLLYSTFVPRDFSFVSASVVGVAYAFVAMAVVTSSVLPRVNPAMREAMPEMGGAWVLAYAVFGLVLGFLPRVRRWYAR